MEKHDAMRILEKRRHYARHPNLYFDKRSTVCQYFLRSLNKNAFRYYENFEFYGCFPEIRNCVP